MMLDAKVYLDLLEVLGDGISMDNFCTIRYERWEVEVATPALHKMGFRNIIWHTAERDSFGPSHRIANCFNEAGEVVNLVYG